MLYTKYYLTSQKTIKQITQTTNWEETFINYMCKTATFFKLNHKKKAIKLEQSPQNEETFNQRMMEEKMIIISIQAKQLKS